jgi:PST family polysaccharide transporter
MSSSNYRNILKTTSLIGGSSLINILIGMVRTKFVAILLGPAGIGLMGVYSAITSMVSTISSMGIGSSGVRQIAAAYGAGNQDQIARTVKTLRRTVWLTGLLGTAAMIIGCAFFSHFSFGTYDYALPIALLSITILLSNITVGQSCILQGKRRIPDLAKVSIIGALNGTAISIPCFYFWGEQGIVPSMIVTSLAVLATSWWFARRVAVKTVEMPWRESGAEAAQLLHFGVPLMLSALMTTLCNYLIRVLLIRQIGLDGIGIWQAAFSLSGILVNFVLGAMSTDYYPRLTAVAENNNRVNDEVNAQTEIAMLLAVPGLAATIIFAPLAITIFYSGKFDAAVDILRWSVYGIFGRVISWPLGFVLLAKGMGKAFFCTEVFSDVFYVFAIWFCTCQWGLPGTGIAFLLLYVVYTIVIYIVVYAISRTTWSRINTVHIIIFCILLAIIGIISTFVVNPWRQFPINCLILAGISVYCLRCLSRKSGITLQMLLIKIWPKS